MRAPCTRKIWARTLSKSSATWSNTTRTRRGDPTTTTGEVLLLHMFGLKVRSGRKEKLEMQKFTFLAYVLLALVLLLFGVVGVVDAQDVRYDFDKDKDFSKYRTYKWVPIKGADRKSTRLNSSHQIISYAVFCLKKKK